MTTGGKRDDDIKRLWSKALGGFSNNDGGVLVWGIDARSTEYNGSKVDAVVGESPMRDPVALASRLTELQRGATDPPTANVVIKPYVNPGDSGTGFVVCFVPAGSFKPYRSEQSGPQWYLRAGDNFVVMSRSVLQSMFFPRLKSRFKVKANLRYRVVQSPGPLKAEMYMDCSFRNTGSGTAKGVFVKIVTDLPLKPLQYDGWIAGHGRSVVAVRALHPDDESGPINLAWDGNVANSQFGLVLKDKRVTVSFDIFCEDQERQTIIANFVVDRYVSGEMQQMSVEAVAEESAELPSAVGPIAITAG